MRTFSSIGLAAGVGIAVACGLVFSNLCVDRAHADGCLAAPNAQPPHGLHWYYRFDKANRRKCWFLHSPMPVVHRTLAHGRAHPVSITRANTRSNSKSHAAASPMPPAEPASSASRGRSGPPVPHIEILAVRPVYAPGVDATSTPRSETSEAAAKPRQPVTRALSAIRKPDPAQPRLQPGQKQTAERDSGAKPGTFVLFVFGLGISALLLGVIVKSASRSGKPAIPARPDAAWRRQRLLRKMADRQEVDVEDGPTDPSWYEEPLRRPRHSQIDYVPPARRARTSVG